MKFRPKHLGPLQGLVFLMVLAIVVFYPKKQANSNENVESKSAVIDFHNEAERLNSKSLPIMTERGAFIKADLQAIEALVSSKGLLVTSTVKEEKDTNSFSMNPQRLYRNDEQLQIKEGQVSIEGESVLLDRQYLIEKFTTSSEGIRQDFIVKNRIEGKDDLTLELKLNGARVSNNEKGIRLKFNSGRELLYHRLKINDANGKVLQGQLARVDEQTISLTVKDQEAIYPIVIDPTLTDGNWVNIYPGIMNADRPVNAIGSFGDDLYIGGDFNVVGSDKVNRIAHWDGNKWDPMGDGLDSIVYDILVNETGVYAFGLFQNSGGLPLNHVAKWDGSTWKPLGEGIDGLPSDIILVGDTIYAMLKVYEEDTLKVTKIKMWDGSTWNTFASIDGWLFKDIEIFRDTLYITGAFSGYSGDAQLAKWNGSSWIKLESEESEEYPLLFTSKMAKKGDTLLVCGLDNNNNNSFVYQLDGDTLKPYLNGSGLVGNCEDLLVAGETLYIFGGMQKLDYPRSFSVAVVENDSVIPITPGLDEDNVYSLGIYKNQLLIGGRFAEINNELSPNIAMYDGQNWNPIQEGMGKVEAMAINKNQLAVAHCMGFSPSNVCLISKWDGYNWVNLGKIAGIVEVVKYWGDTLVVGGSFTEVDSVVTPGVAMWADGRWFAVESTIETQFYKRVLDIVLNNDAMYISGEFGYESKNLNNIAKWEMGEWKNLGQGLTYSGSMHRTYVSGIAQVGGSVFAIGTFNLMSDSIYFGGTYVEWDGEKWTGFDLGIPSSRIGQFKSFKNQLYATYGDWDEPERVMKINGLEWEYLPYKDSCYYEIKDVTPFGLLLYESGVGAVDCNGLSIYDGSNLTSFDAKLPEDFNLDNLGLIQMDEEMMAVYGFKSGMKFIGMKQINDDMTLNDNKVVNSVEAESQYVKVFDMRGVVKYKGAITEINKLGLPSGLYLMQRENDIIKVRAN